MQYHKWIFLGFGALCLVIVASLLNAEHLYYMAAILLTLPAISYGLGWCALRGLKVTRTLPPDAWAGEESEIVYSIENPSPVARFFLTIREGFPDWIVPGRAETPLFNVQAQGTAQTIQRVRLKRRGVYRTEGFEMTAMDPLGVFAFSRRVLSDGELVVYPMPGPSIRLPLSGADRYGWQDTTSAALRGSSVDLDGIRTYVPGDSLRRIHWRQTARTGTLTVMEFEETVSQQLVLVPDLLQGTAYGAGTETTLEYAVRLTATLAKQALEEGAEVRLILPNSPSLQGYPSSLNGRGQDHLHLILGALARAEADATTPMSELLGSIGELASGTRLVVMTAKTERGLPEALSRFTSTGADVSLIYLDPSTFPGAGRRKAPAERSRFFSELLAVHARPLLVEANAEQELRIQEIA